ncbi:MAG: peptidase MA family metallohydrolase [Verrucomicrobia bacterium]|nr:peptidase MA family metallohydrolase [Verrucomicrobiota bacterium]
MPFRARIRSYVPFLSLPDGRTLVRLFLFGWVLCLLQTGTGIQSATLEEYQTKLFKGDYASCVRLCEEALKERFADEEWAIQLARVRMIQGQYPEAQNVVSNALTRYYQSIRVRLTARDVYRMNGRAPEGKLMLDEINRLVGSRRWAYSDAANQVALGQAALLLGADAKLVLENFYNPVKKDEPKYRETYLAIGELTLDKNDMQMAERNFTEGVKLFPDDPDLRCGLARSYAGSNRPKMIEQLETALEKNEKHAPSLLLLDDHMIDAEEYAEAEKYLEKVFAVNKVHPEAWGYRAVLAHLMSDSDLEQKALNTALLHWKTNPRVAHLIGRKLSQKYRFEEGAAYQRKAVEWDPTYLPAKIQLAQDLLRLGYEDEGWQLADEVHQKDGYDVGAFNLVTLHENLARFQILTNEHFSVRMHEREVEIYGAAVLDLLERARIALCEKYGFTQTQTTIVEIFPEQKDFAVRTFGMPGGEGYLGVCFGRVITANSPASQTGNPSNWQAVLWHEFCHVVTLSLTRNKMPRWLSEGISVYEERLANPAWGQAMTPRYREMIMEGELTSVGELSAAFLTPKSGLHLQFAYYESSLVVEYLVQEYGIDSLRRILRDLGEGKSINQAIEASTAPLETIEKGFQAFVQKRAGDLGPGLEWKHPDETDLAREDAGWMEKYPKNYWVLLRKAKMMLSEKKWEEAKVPLKTLIENYPDQTGSDSAYLLLAAAHRGLNETEDERRMLAKLALLDADATDAFLRLMELDSGIGDWQPVAKNAERFLAVNPLLPQPHRFLGKASEALNETGKAIHSYQTLLKLNPPDPAEVHFRLAKLLRGEGDPQAHRHVLLALEEAPRFRDAHRLLLEIRSQSNHDVTQGKDKKVEASPESTP